MSDTAPTTQPQSAARRDSLSVVAVAILALLATAWFLVPRSLTWKAPTLLGKAGGFPEDVRRDNGVWYWVERPEKSKATLVRATPGAVQPVATGDAIAGFTLAENALTWTQQEGGRWSVMQAGRDGKNPKPLWSGTDAPFGVQWVAGKLYWLRRSAPVIADAGPFAPLAGHLELVTLPSGATAPTVVTTLPESGDGSILGKWGDGLVVVIYRRDNPGSTSLYSVPLSGGAPTRFHSAMRQTTPVLTAQGVLYGLVPSEEATLPLETLVLHRFTTDGRAEPIADWLPIDGDLYATTRGVVYADRESPPTFWTVESIGKLPQAIPLPQEYFAVAAGEDMLLVGAATSTRNTPELYEVGQP